MFFRLAYPSADLTAIRRFYGEALELIELLSFTGHEGYDGVVYRLPDSSHELEFTRRTGDTFVAAHEDVLIAINFDDASKFAAAVRAVEGNGHRRVHARNPYWNSRGVVFADPDGRHVVLVLPIGR